MKLNTVVTALNCREDMSAFVLRFQPERWKVFQVLPMAGQNDGDVEPLLIDDDSFPPSSSGTSPWWRRASGPSPRATTTCRAPT